MFVTEDGLRKSNETNLNIRVQTHVKINVRCTRKSYNNSKDVINSYFIIIII